MNDFSETVNRMYQDEIGAFGLEGGQLSDAIKSLTPKVRAMVDRGELDIDVDGAIEAEIRTIDQSNGKLTDKVISSLAFGQAQFDLHPDPLLDVVVTLGQGLRKQWRDVTPQDLVLMDQLRYENVRKQQDAYSVWRSSFAPVAALLAPYSSVGAAASAGAFTDSERRTA